MALFYTASPKELLQIRNKIFLDVGLPALQKNGFEKSPFSTAWFGKNEDVGYSYELCRLVGLDTFEIISVHIVRRDIWIQIFLNIFKIQPHLDSINQLRNLDGLKFHLPPNSASSMRLKSDDIVGPPILNRDYMFRNHKLKAYYTKPGLAKRADELEKIIARDLNNIEYFIKRWNEIHKPMVTTWEGTPIST